MPVVAKASCRVAGRRARTFISKGQIFEDDSPIVQARPELFEPVEQHHQRETRPRGTPDLGRRSMSARGVESARRAPGEVRDIDYPCPNAGCDWRGASERAVKTHVSKAHG